MDWRVASVDLHDVVQQKQFGDMHSIDTLCMLRKHDCEHGQVPRVFRRIFFSGFVDDRRLPNDRLEFVDLGQELELLPEKFLG
jgi:hypothetical protein